MEYIGHGRLVVYCDGLVSIWSRVLGCIAALDILKRVRLSITKYAVCRHAHTYATYVHGINIGKLLVAIVTNSHMPGVPGRRSLQMFDCVLCGNALGTLIWS
jgi:hypothetical protein